MFLPTDLYPTNRETSYFPVNTKPLKFLVSSFLSTQLVPCFHHLFLKVFLPLKRTPSSKTIFIIRPCWNLFYPYYTPIASPLILQTYFLFSLNAHIYRIYHHNILLFFPMWPHACYIHSTHTLMILKQQRGMDPIGS